MADLNIKILGLLTRFLQAVLFAVGVLVFTVLILTGTEGGCILVAETGCTGCR